MVIKALYQTSKNVLVIFLPEVFARANLLTDKTIMDMYNKRDKSVKEVIWKNSNDIFHPEWHFFLTFLFYFCYFKFCLCKFKPVHFCKEYWCAPTD